jgi:hypothetical protein
MTQPPGTQPSFQHTPLSADETARAEANFVPYVAEALAATGRFRVTADSPEMVELFQKVARRAGEVLRRPVVSYANGREIVITVGHETPGVTGNRPLLRPVIGNQRSQRVRVVRLALQR